MSGHAQPWRPTPYVAFSALLHAAAVGVLAVQPAVWAWVVGGLCLNHAGLALGALLPGSRLLGPNIRRLSDTATARGEVGLTFDDGPDPVVTPLILDLLAEAGCSASFFFVGKRAERYGEIVVETARRGHSVENHTYEHSSAFAFHRPSVLVREIDRTQEILEKLTGRPPSFFRAPAGIRNMLLHPVLHRRGLSLVSWTRRGFDTVARCPKSVAGRLTRGLTAGDVLLLHDGSSACDRHGEPVVLESLKITLDELERRGLKGVGLFPAQQNDPGMSSV